MAAAQGVLYAIVLPDGRPLIAAAQIPVLLVGGAWLIAALLHARAARAACMRCGRIEVVRRWTNPAEALRWGRWAVALAVVAPSACASSCLAWALGIPYGVTSDFVVEMRADEPTIFVAGAMMALLGLAGAVLTFGLVATWGERCPRWVPYLGGRRVPPRLAIVPTAVVAVLLLCAGKAWYVSAVLGHLPEAVFGPNWATVFFGATLPFWGLALAAAGYAYWLRRRGVCRCCGRGHPETLPLEVHEEGHRDSRQIEKRAPLGEGVGNHDASQQVQEVPGRVSEQAHRDQDSARVGVQPERDHRGRGEGRDPPRAAKSVPGGLFDQRRSAILAITTTRVATASDVLE